MLLDRAERAKVKLLDRRLDVPDGKRDFPAYLDWNRFLSNLPGTTLLLPVVDLSHQYINGLMYLLTQPAGARPTLVDDRNFYRPAGVKKWVENGFLNKDLKVAARHHRGQMRTQIEADLIVQNLFLTAEAMGLGAWIQATMSPPVLLGDPKFIKTYGPMLGFDFVTPKRKLADLLRWQVPLLRYAAICARTRSGCATRRTSRSRKGSCPPYYDSMADAVDAVIAAKFGPGAASTATRRPSNRSAGTASPETHLREASRLREECDRLRPATSRTGIHADVLAASRPMSSWTIFVPGSGLQVHRVEIEYYDRFFRNGLEPGPSRP